VSDGWYVRTNVSRPGRLFRNLFAWNHGPDAEIVGVGNFVAACGVGIVLYAVRDVSFATSAAAAAIAFVVLTVFLLHRATFWVSAVVGGLATAVVPALLLAGAGAMFFDVAGLWVGALLGLVTGLGVAISSYRAVFRATRSSAHT
jgi:hypothetical protein